jgi:hypothetical protein
LRSRPPQRTFGRLRFHSKHLTKLNSRPIRFSKIYATHRRCFQSSDLLRASKGDSIRQTLAIYKCFASFKANQDYICFTEPCVRIRETCGSVRNSSLRLIRYGTASTGSLVHCPLARLPNSGRGCKFFSLLSTRARHRLAASLCFRDKTNLSDALLGWQAFDAVFCGNLAAGIYLLIFQHFVAPIGR